MNPGSIAVVILAGDEGSEQLTLADGPRRMLMIYAQRLPLR